MIEYAFKHVSGRIHRWLVLMVTCGGGQELGGGGERVGRDFPLSVFLYVLNFQPCACLIYLKNKVLKIEASYECIKGTE